MVVASGLELVGRNEELALLRQFAGDLGDRPGARVIRGDAGIGKTVLWRAGLDAAEEAGVRVLVTRCAEAEMPLALGGLGDLLDRAFDDVADELAEPQRRALAVALGLEAPSNETAGRIALPRAFVAFLRALSGRSPVLVAIDDVQWLDAPSKRVLSFAVKRLGDTPVGLLVTQRGDSDDPLDLRHALDDRLAEVRLGPLSVGALHHLLRIRLGVRIPRPLLARVHEASGGNPMFALEFARSLHGRDRHHLGPMPIPAALHELVRAAVSRYPQEVRRLLAIVAAADRPTASLLANVDASVAGSLDAALDAGAVAIGDDGVVRFTHPLRASAAYGELPPSERRDLHAKLARVSDDLEARARHLALATAEADGTVAAVLDQAAARAHARGAHEAAAELAREAVRMTPPADISDGDQRAIAVAVYLGAAGRTADVAAWLDRILAAGPAGPRRARVLLLRVGLVEHDVEAGGRALAEVLEHAGDDLALRARALMQTTAYHWYRDDLVASEKTARQGLAAAEEAGDPRLLAWALATVADLADRAGRPEPELLQRATALADVHGMPSRFPTLRELRARRLLRAGDLNGARDLLEAGLRVALQAGIEPECCRLWKELADTEWRAGNWELARRYVDEASQYALDGGDLWAEAELLERKGRFAALHGDVAGARGLVARGIASAEAMHWPHLAAMNRWVLGFLELSLDEPMRAWEALADVGATPAWGRLEVLNAVADAVETLTTLGRFEAAGDLLATLHDAARSGHRWAAPAALRCEARLLVARGESAAAVAAAGEAADLFRAGGFRLDRGRALLIAGEALRRAGERRRAAVELEAAGTEFAELGAALWAERAAKELRRARPRARRDRQLTSAERQVAALVAAGRKNREVAAQLFTTEATVEAHLTRIYRKLDVRSRTELARLVADGTLSIADD